MCLEKSPSRCSGEFPAYSGPRRLAIMFYSSLTSRKTSAQAFHHLSSPYPYISFSLRPGFTLLLSYWQAPRWYLCHIFNMDMGMIIKSIVAKRVRSALNNGWARMRLNLWGRTERQGKCSHRPLRPPPLLSSSPERHYSGRSFLPSLDIIQCNHPSIKNLLVIKGTTRVNTQNMEKDDPVLRDGL